MRLYGAGLAFCGLIYLIKPDLYRRWFWKRTSLAQRLLSPENHLLYMRFLGFVFLVLGLILFFRV